MHYYQLNICSELYCNYCILMNPLKGSTYYTCPMDYLAIGTLVNKVIKFVFSLLNSNFYLYL